MRYFLFFVSILLISSCALQDKSETKQVRFKNPIFENTWEPFSWQPYNAMKIYPDRLEFFYTEMRNMYMPEDDRYTADCELLENEQTYIKMHCLNYPKGFKDEAFEDNIKFSLEWSEHYNKIKLSYTDYDSDFKDWSGISWYGSKEPTIKADLYKTRGD